jgi:hypothetical protein
MSISCDDYLLHYDFEFFLNFNKSKQIKDKISMIKRKKSLEMFCLYNAPFDK